MGVLEVDANLNTFGTGVEGGSHGLCNVLAEEKC